MRLQYLTDNRGNRNAVVLSINDWNRVQSDIDELKKLRNKKLFLIKLQEAVMEMNLISEGKQTSRNLQDLINEL